MIATRCRHVHGDGLNARGRTRSRVEVQRRGHRRPCDCSGPCAARCRDVGARGQAGKRAAGAAAEADLGVRPATAGAGAVFTSQPRRRDAAAPPQPSHPKRGGTASGWHWPAWMSYSGLPPRASSVTAAELSQHASAGAFVGLLKCAFLLISIDFPLILYRFSTDLGLFSVGLLGVGGTMSDLEKV